MKAIIGKKVGMSQIFDENGHVIPVTVIEAGPCVVVQKKTSEKEGYEAVQLGFEDISERKLTKPEKGHLDKAGVAPKKYLREFDLENAAELNVGDIVKADAFQAGDFVDVTGISKGHGYQGVIKRHGAHRLKETHGSGPVVRHAGSMGANSDPSRIFKGKIGDVLREVRGGFNFGKVLLEGIAEYKGQSAYVEFQNENLTATVEGEILATTPDLICLVDTDTFQPVPTDALKYGKRVMVVGLKCFPLWRTQAGLDLVGPRYFGVDTDYIPLEERCKGGRA